MTWAIRHPWFSPPTVKRRLSANGDGDASSVDEPPSMFSTSRRKRVRYNSLERTLAHMTLGGAFPTSEDVEMWPKNPPPHPRVVEDIILPSSVEEPASDVVDMEVEPIPTTDTSAPTPVLHAIDDWESKESGLEITEVQISSAVLECLRRQTKRPPPLIPLPSQPSQALVLYRTPRPPSAKPWTPACQDEEGQPTRTPSLLVPEEDVMDVEQT